MYSLTGYVHKYFLGYNKFRQMESNAMIRNFFPGLRKRVVFVRKCCRIMTKDLQTLFCIIW